MGLGGLPGECRCGRNELACGAGALRLSRGGSRLTLEELIRRVSELASGLTRNQMSRDGLWVRIPCPPLLFSAVLPAFSAGLLRASLDVPLSAQARRQPA